MSSNNQPWYEAFMKDSNQHVVLGNDEKAPPQWAQENNHSVLQSPHDDTGSLAKMFMVSQLPPSLFAAAEDSHSGLLYRHELQYDMSEANTAPIDELDEELATTPYSFYQRSLQYQCGMAASPNDPVVEVSAYPKRDSVIGSLHNSIEFAASEVVADGPFEYTGLVQSKDCSCRTNPLQYHLLEAKAARECTGGGSASVVPRNAPLRTASSSPSSDSQWLSCPLCTDKRYTGVWAHRNLTRHMERVHAPCSSLGGIKQFPCSHVDCERTFRREDARLVHERRSHPDLNRPPPTKRRKSGELRA